MALSPAAEEREARKGFRGRVANVLGVSPAPRGAAFLMRDGDSGHACAQPLCYPDSRSQGGRGGTSSSDEDPTSGFISLRRLPDVCDESDLSPNKTSHQTLTLNTDKHREALSEGKGGRGAYVMG